MSAVLDADDVLGGRYRLVALIATGGMGQVWQGVDQLLDRTVAVKVLKAEYASDPGFLDRFRSEARNAARLSHPNIAAVYDYGETSKGAGSASSAYLVMELVVGEPLSDLIAREGALDPRRAGALVAATARGLGAAHRASLVHRDVKPGNLMVTPDGSVKITDFGISRAAAQTPLTATGQVMGTAAYFSPEQAVGRREIGPEADLYALGVVLHEMLTGTRPFTGDSQVAIAMAQVQQDPPALPVEVGPGSAALVDALLVKEPERRPHDAAAVAAVADALADGDDALAVARLGAAVPAAPGGHGPAAPTVAATVSRRSAGGGAAGAAAAGAGVVGAASAGAASAGSTRVAPPTRVAPAATTGTGRAAGEAWAAPTPPATAAPHVPVPSQPLRGAGVAGGRGPRRMTTPLLGLIAVLVIVLLAALYAVVTSSGDGAPPPTTGTTAPADPDPQDATDPPDPQDPAPTTDAPDSPDPSTSSTSTPGSTTPAPTRTLPTQIPLPSPPDGTPTAPGAPTRPTEPPADGGGDGGGDTSGDADQQGGDTGG